MRTQLPTTQRRHRYYAYEAKSGGLLWMDRTTHEAIKRRPHTIALHQCAGYAGQSRLMTMDEWKVVRLEWSRGRGRL